jgi:hypothetical protein
MMRRARAGAFVVACFALGACGQDGPNSGASADAAGGASASGGTGGAAGDGGSSGTGSAGASAGAGGASGRGTDAGSDAPVSACGCLLGEGAYCSARAADEAAAAGCEIPALDGNAGDLLKCENDQWSKLEDCKGQCDYDASSPRLDDACVLPVCDCFVQVAWCGSGAAKEAAQMGCRIPLLPEHDGDILYCPGGKWSVKQSCSLGCVEAPQGTPDYCKSNSDYRAPYDCNTTQTCSNGNATSSHTGKDQYAYDFAMPVGTTVRAMRAGTVLRVRMVSKPGSPCYNGGGSSCANYANTVEVKHSDGTVALYMHLSSASVSQGDAVAQGTVLGKSGNSGWSTGPHTHVQIQKNCGIWWCQSVPFKLVEDSTISAGTKVTSKNCP